MTPGGLSVLVKVPSGSKLYRAKVLDKDKTSLRESIIIAKSKQFDSNLRSVTKFQSWHVNCSVSKAIYLYRK